MNKMNPIYEHNLFFFFFIEKCRFSYIYTCAKWWSIEAEWLLSTYWMYELEKKYEGKQELHNRDEKKAKMLGDKMK